MGKKDQPKPPEPAPTDAPLTVQPGEQVVEQTDAHLEGHGTHD